MTHLLRAASGAFVAFLVPAVLVVLAVAPGARAVPLTIVYSLAGNTFQLGATTYVAVNDDIGPTTGDASLMTLSYSGSTGPLNAAGTTVQIESFDILAAPATAGGGPQSGLGFRIQLTAPAAGGGSAFGTASWKGSYFNVVNGTNSFSLGTAVNILIRTATVTVTGPGLSFVNFVTGGNSQTGMLNALTALGKAPTPKLYGFPTGPGVFSWMGSPANGTVGGAFSAATAGSVPFTGMYLGQEIFRSSVAVPEPGTTTLLGFGLLALAATGAGRAVRRRR